MPTQTARSRLPAQVQEFLEIFAESGDYKSAAEAVGCHPHNAARFYRDTMIHPDAREAFDQIMRTRFANAAPLAMSLLVEMVRNERKEFSGPVRLEAAKDLLNRSGYSTRALAQPAAEKDMRELSRDDLLRIVNEGEAELAQRAKLVDNVPIADADTTQVIDIEE